ncbi:protein MICRORCHIDIA 6 isoform X2 [Mercurialis annua]|nr:protein MICRORCHIDIA 6 isoform X2 [Mercurialis annua]
MFLHSNATSHKWAFGAIAELLDNAVDEIQNGATSVIVDKISNPRDGSPALLIQDDGGGMNPEAMRQCMSFGFSDKSKSAIGQYGNGFKTSTMRLGADVIVFSRHLRNRVLTQSIGLLSYTFLTQTGYDRIVVPMVDYEFNSATGSFEFSNRCSKELSMSNLSLLLQWSPYSTEEELLKQFDDIGSHGTKVIIYNLWFSDDGILELDFDTESEDIRISGDIKQVETSLAWKKINEQHIGNRFRYSLRVYISILYLRIPETFRIKLRGRIVEHHNLANDLKFPEFILYKPQSGGVLEGQVITTIGFLKEAPQINLHGFSVYHKNRLILPFWAVVKQFGWDCRGRGVVGVLEANFIEPTHDKQDFERTSLLQKLESRLKDMTHEYWYHHCGLIGYKVIKKMPKQDSLGFAHGKTKPVKLNHGSSVPSSGKVSPAAVLGMKRKEHDDLVDAEDMKKHARTGVNGTVSGQSFGAQTVDIANQSKYQGHEALVLTQENKKLQAQCDEYEKTEKELEMKITQLKIAIGGVQCEYDRLIAELTALDSVKEEKLVNM